mgnify:CR=1 FL=1
MRELAEKFKITSAQLALSWCAQVDGVTSSNIGATTLDQLKDDIAAFEIDLPEQVLKDIDAIIRKYPIPF